MQDESSKLRQLMRLQEYQETRNHIFPSKSSQDWYVRQHRDRLVADGALLMIAGTWHVQPARFDEIVLELGAKAAQRRQREAA